MKTTNDFPVLVDPADGRLLREVAGGLTAGGETYRFTNGIPRLVPGETSYADAFGDQWNRWRLTQLDSYTGVPISRIRLLRCLGDAIRNQLANASRHIDVLEAGCGAGRFTEVLLSLPAVRLPPAMRMRVCEALTAAILPIHRAVRRFPLAQQAISRLSPLLTYYHAHPELADHHQREWALLDTHDSLTDWYKHLQTPIQIRTILERLRACEIQVVAGGNGVEARCRRPV